MTALKSKEIAAFKSYTKLRRTLGPNHPRTLFARDRYNALERELDRTWEFLGKHNRR